MDLDRPNHPKNGSRRQTGRRRDQPLRNGSKEPGPDEHGRPVGAAGGNDFQENRKDLKRAGEAGLSGAMVDRLTVTDKTIAAMAGGLREVAAYPDPVGTMGETRVRPNGLRVSKMRIP
jgi:hypothetical protein